MNRDIIEKLDKHVLGEGVRSEAGVVYLLIQLAKLVERANRRDAYPYLVFYRNWVAHSKLDRSVLLVDEFCDVIERGGAEGWDAEKVTENLSKQVGRSLAGLRANIRAAFESLEDPETGTRFNEALYGPDAQWWSAVARFLSSILSDIPVGTRDGRVAFQLSSEVNVLWISCGGESFCVNWSVPVD